MMRPDVIYMMDNYQYISQKVYIFCTSFNIVYNCNWFPFLVMCYMSILAIEFRNTVKVIFVSDNLTENTTYLRIQKHMEIIYAEQDHKQVT